MYIYIYICIYTLRTNPGKKLDISRKLPDSNLSGYIQLSGGICSPKLPGFAGKSYRDSVYVVISLLFHCNFIVVSLLVHCYFVVVSCFMLQFHCSYVVIMCNYNENTINML